MSGESDITTYASSDTHERRFCSLCGSNILVALIEEPEAIYLSMGAIDGNPDHPEGYHNYVGSKAPWHEIADGQQQFDTEPDVWP